MNTSRADTPRDTQKRNIILFVTTIGSFLTPFMGSSLNVALPALGNEFNINALLLSWIPTSYLLAAAMCLVPIGRIADIMGRQKVFFYGVIIFGIFSFLCSMARDFLFFIVCRIFQGIGGAMIFGTAVAILTGIFPIQQRGRVLGINVAGVYLGLSLGPILGGILTQNLGWRSIFYLNAFLGFLMFFLIIIFLKLEKEKFTLKNFDYIGTLFYSPMLFLLMYGFSLLPQILGFVLLLIGIIFLFIFIRFEMNAIQPLLNFGLFKANPVFLFSNLAALINYSATNAVSFLLSLYLQYIKGYPPQQAGIILIAQPLTMTLLSPVAGRLSDRLQPQIIASTGMGLTGLGLFFLSFINSSFSVDSIIIYLLILGLGFALFSSPNTNAVMSSVEKANYGIASSTLATMRLLGQMSSMGIVMLIFSLILGRIKITPEVYPLFINALKIAFYIFTGLCIFGVYASLKRGKIKRE
uniref:MFS transporter n=1 Tax=candidate division WOR-3 bacterium TaxID=2052148 RepID=A0A7C6AFZ1_UNCW3